MHLNYDKLLEYFSCLKQGSWNQFKQALNNINYDEIDLNYAVERQMFSRLGHIEFIFEPKPQFCINKPALGMIPNSNEAILCGYRTPKFFEKLCYICKQNDIIVKEYENNNAPKLIILNFEKDYQQSIINKHIPIIHKFSQKVINFIPSVEEYYENLNPLENFRFQNYDLQIYNTEMKKFINFGKSQVPKEGLYRMRTYEKDRFFIYFSDKWFETDKSYGICKVFEIKRKNNLFNYKDNCLYINEYITLPELADRAISLCSGINPKIKNEYRIYKNIPYEVAKITASKLGQILE